MVVENMEQWMARVREERKKVKRVDSWVNTSCFGACKLAADSVVHPHFSATLLRVNHAPR